MHLYLIALVGRNSAPQLDSRVDVALFRIAISLVERRAEYHF